MSKNRRIPFGYMIKNGVITTEPKEVYVVIKIFDEYLSGKSLNDIANQMQIEGIPYHPNEVNSWNRNMIKRIIENEKYLGTDKYPKLIDDVKFRKANEVKTKKATNLCMIPESVKEIRNLTVCDQCRKRMFRTQNGTWTCKTVRCIGIKHKVTDQMIISAVLNMLNSVIANLSLLDAGGELSIYKPNGHVAKQTNEINRMLDHTEIDHERIKAELFKLAEMKYKCCSYDDVPQNTEYLKDLFSNIKSLDSLDIELLKKVVRNIVISCYADISLEMINGVSIINTTARKEYNTYECYSDTCNENS
ncbi:recombinase family protein [Ruminococcus albus]|uniref:Recombinase n=1 Tax=Ruminococcus albus TaxID=1264 RepID=A0A1I1QFA3_RUMAL|nr:recombinase family protein [Ruminococcus albus]SFD20749.1 Recombinase [Ruminococcus albus]